MNNHRKWIKKGKTFKALRTSTQRGIGCSRPEVFCEKDVLRNLATFIRKQLCSSLFFNKVAGLTLLKRRLGHRCLAKFCEISKNTFF